MGNMEEKSLDQLEELDIETSTKFQLGLIFSLGYLSMQRDCLVQSLVTKALIFSVTSINHSRF